MELILEVNDRDLPNKGDLGIIGSSHVMMTPPIDEDYWYFRVRLNDSGQAIVGFPKFSGIGIGFAQEGEDWNCNLPFVCSAAKIYRHIAHNKGSIAIRSQDCIEAIELIREAARRFKGLSDDDWQAEQSENGKAFSNREKYEMISEKDAIRRRIEHARAFPGSDWEQKANREGVADCSGCHKRTPVVYDSQLQWCKGCYPLAAPFSQDTQPKKWQERRTGQERDYEWRSATTGSVTE
jgi:hypothetical protein